MNKLAFVFPGQGAQTVGMGKDLFDQYDVAKRLFAEADEALGYSIKDMCFEGPADDLKLTANTQPAILTVSVIVNEILKEHGVSRMSLAAIASASIRPLSQQASSPLRMPSHSSTSAASTCRRPSP